MLYEKKMKKKETIKYISLGLILLVIFFLPKEASAGIGQSILDATFGTAFASLGLVFVGLMAAILKIAGEIFDTVIGMTLLKPGINNIAAVQIGWRIIRDISNLFLIFALVFIAIATILQIESYGVKKLILPLILVALLINFSLAVTKFIIDISNILALQFYYAVQVQTPGQGTAGASDIEFKSLSSVFMAGTQLQSVYEYDFKDSSTIDRESGSEFSAEVEVKPTEEITNWNIGKAQWLGGILFAIAAFVFFAGAILFIIRQVSLLILMVLSPLAFVFGIFPGTKKHGQQWWNALFSQAFFAPAYLFMFYLTAKIAQDSSFLALIGVGTKDGQKAASLGEYLAGHAATKAVPEGGYLLNFLIMAALMIGALWVAKQMGAIGADMTWKWGGGIKKKLSGYAGGTAVGLGRLATKHTIGRAGEEIAESRWMKERAARHPIIGGYFARVAKKIGKTGQLDKLRDEQIAMGMTLSPQQRAQYMLGLPKAVKEGMFGKMSDREIAEMEMKASEENRPKIDALIASMPETKKEKVYEAMGKRALEGDNAYTLEIYNKARKAENKTVIEYIIKNMNAAQMPSFVNQIKEKDRAEFVKTTEDIGKKLELRIFKADPRFVEYGKEQAKKINDAMAIGGQGAADAERVKLMTEEIKQNRIDIENIDKSMADISKKENDLFMQALVKGLQPGLIQKLIDRGAPFSEKYGEYLQKIIDKKHMGSKEIADAVEALKDAGNLSAARWLESPLSTAEMFGLKRSPSSVASGAAGTTTAPPTGGGQPTTPTSTPPSSPPPSSGSTTTPQATTPPPGTSRSGGPPGYQVPP